MRNAWKSRWYQVRSNTVSFRRRHNIDLNTSSSNQRSDENNGLMLDGWDGYKPKVCQSFYSQKHSFAVSVGMKQRTLLLYYGSFANSGKGYILDDKQLRITKLWNMNTALWHFVTKLLSTVDYLLDIIIWRIKYFNMILTAQIWSLDRKHFATSRGGIVGAYLISVACRMWLRNSWSTEKWPQQMSSHSTNVSFYPVSQYPIKCWPGCRIIWFLFC